MTTNAPLPRISTSNVNFRSEMNESDLKLKSIWDPNWTIQREISITMDQTLNKSSKCFSIRIQILTGFGLFILLILSIILPILIFLVDPRSTSRITSTSTIPTSPIESNNSSRRLDIYSCETLLYIGEINLIGFDILSHSSMSWSTCCSWCLNILSCRALTYSISSSICYLKTTGNTNGTFDRMHRSAKYP